MTRFKPLPKPPKGIKPKATTTAPRKATSKAPQPSAPVEPEPLEAPPAPPEAATEDRPFGVIKLGGTAYDLPLPERFPVGWTMIEGGLESEGPVLSVDDPGEPYAGDLPLVANPRVRFEISGSVPESESAHYGQLFADLIGFQVAVAGMDGEIRQRFAPRPIEAKPKNVRVRSEDIDWTVRPVITSPTNLGINTLLGNIEEARGDLANLESFVGTFSGSTGTEEALKKASTYYRKAAKYLHALIAEARVQPASEPHEDEGDLQAA